MFKLATLIGTLAFLCSSWLSGFSIPRLVQGPVDYLLMPLLGYIMIVMAAQLAARLIPEKHKPRQKSGNLVRAYKAKDEALQKF